MLGGASDDTHDRQFSCNLQEFYVTKVTLVTYGAYGARASSAAGLSRAERKMLASSP